MALALLLVPLSPLQLLQLPAVQGVCTAAAAGEPEVAGREGVQAAAAAHAAGRAERQGGGCREDGPQAVMRDGGKMLYSYTHASNDFAMTLTAAQVQRMRRHPSVASVTPSRTITCRTITVADSYKSLKLPHARAATAATPAGAPSDGEGTVIGIVDRGVWPEHPSFDDTGYSSTLPAGWAGTCLCPTTSDFACNNKIIRGCVFHAGSAVRSPHGIRMAMAHGVPEATSNSGVEVLGGGTISGVAIYKVYWLDVGTTVTNAADVFAAIDQAVADGVDVITLSLDNANRNMYDDDYAKWSVTYFDDVPFIGALAVSMRGMRWECEGHAVGA
ncbi:unnamed protein product [Closterium sp. Naga37s-1]|nr:unnamed protein product [Closterium sp. Naga37s-1]